MPPSKRFCGTSSKIHKATIQVDCKDYVKVFKIPNSPEISGKLTLLFCLQPLQVNVQITPKKTYQLLPTVEECVLNDHLADVVTCLIRAFLFIGFFSDDHSLWICMTPDSVPGGRKRTISDFIDQFDSLLHVLVPDLQSEDNTNITNELDEDETFGGDVSFLYSCLSMHPLNASISFPSIVASSPYPHQQQAILWMCSREGMNVCAEEEARCDQLHQSLHPLFCVWPCQPHTFFSLSTHLITNEYPRNECIRHGGVLCDTMGLGKTYEMLMLILLHPRPVNEFIQIQSLVKWESTVYQHQTELGANELHRQLRKLLRQYENQSEPDQEWEDNIVLKEQRTIAITSQLSKQDCVHKLFLAKAPSIIRRDEVFCVCGDLPLLSKRGRLIQCSNCQKYQHYGCVFGNSIMPISADDYVCYDCEKVLSSSQPRIPCKTTLIFTPAHICVQWIDELRKHITSSDDDTHSIDNVFCEGSIHGIRYLLYPGSDVIHSQLKHGTVNNRIPLLLHPEFIAQFDLVFVQYETFHRDYLAFVSKKRTLRHASRYPTFTSPLFRLQFWRIVLDEMHLVEVNEQELLRCDSLERVNLWCVSGTPFNRDISELYAVMLLLQIPFYSWKWIWNRAITIPLQKNSRQARSRIHSIITEYFWCTTFSDLNRLSPNLIPPQYRKIHHILLSGVERTHYQKVRASCLRLIDPFLVKRQKQYGDRFNTSQLSRDDLFMILRILKPLRQACCHYQIGNHWLSPQQHVMSLAEIQSNLEETIQIDCEGAWRDVVATRNAICGLLILQGNRIEAINRYQQTLKDCEKQIELNSIHTDHLQTIHCLHNLIEMNQIESTLSCDEIERLLMEKQREETIYVSRSNDALNQTIREKKIGMNWMDRFVSLFHIIDKCYHSLTPTNSLLDKEYSIESIAHDMELGWVPSQTEISLSYHDLPSLPKLLTVCKVIQSSSYGNASISSKKRKTSSILDLQKTINVIIELSVHASDLVVMGMENLRQLIYQWSVCVIFLRDYICDTLSTFNQEPTEDLVTQCSQCKRCNEFVKDEPNMHFMSHSNKNGNLCAHCQLDRILQIYDCLIFDRKLTREGDVEATGRVTTPSVTISLMHMLRRKCLKTLTQKEKDAIQHLVNDLTQEALDIHTVWKCQHTHILCYEELRQCQSRLHLEKEYQFEGVTGIRTVNQSDLEWLLHDQLLSLQGFEKKYSELLAQYHFIQSSSSQRIDYASHTCSICYSQLQPPITVLPCGHLFCTQCFTLFSTTRIEQGYPISCPICNRQITLEQVVVVSEEDSDENALELKWGSKMGKIVSIIQSILNDDDADPESKKILVYSQWEDSLFILAHVLKESNIRYLVMNRTKHYENTFQFRNDPKIPVFLMRLQQGNNGLDLSVATHVIVMEPVLSATVEAQAVSRVKRIGQRFVSYVHYVLVDGTTESRIFELFERRKEQEANKRGYGVKESESMSGNELRSLLTE